MIIEDRGPPLRLIAAYGIMEKMIFRDEGGELVEEMIPIPIFQIFTVRGWDEEVKALLIERIHLSAEYRVTSLDFIDLSDTPSVSQFVQQFIGSYSLN